MCFCDADWDPIKIHSALKYWKGPEDTCGNPSWDIPRIRRGNPLYIYILSRSTVPFPLTHVIKRVRCLPCQQLCLRPPFTSIQEIAYLQEMLGLSLWHLHHPLNYMIEAKLNEQLQCGNITITLPVYKEILYPDLPRQPGDSRYPWFMSLSLFMGCYHICRFSESRAFRVKDCSQDLTGELWALEAEGLKMHYNLITLHKSTVNHYDVIE